MTQEHIPGRPIYSVGDFVSFRMTIDGNVETFEGVVKVVDSFGAWEIDNPREPSYDILVCNWRGSGNMMLVKHIRESKIESWRDSGKPALVKRIRESAIKKD